MNAIRVYIFGMITVGQEMLAKLNNSANSHKN